MQKIGKQVSATVPDKIHDQLKVLAKEHHKNNLSDAVRLAVIRYVEDQDTPRSDGEAVSR
jgi:predicted DNA-binding ribbon-helix-helix protein